MKTQIYEDSYYRIFNDYNSLTDEVTILNEDSKWLPEIISSKLRLSSFEPIESQSIVAKTGVDYDIVFDTGNSTQLLLEYGEEKYLVRDTAVDTITETAKIAGSALGRMSPYLFSEVLNNCFTVARGNSLFLIRGGKLCACLSDNIYEVMPINKLLSITYNALTKQFGHIEFKTGENSYSFTSALWELPDAQDKLIESYENVVKTHAKALHSHNFMPVVRFITSDVGKYAATLIPMFKMPNGACFRLNSGIKVLHKQNKFGEKTGIETYAEECENIFAKFTDIEKTLVAMSECQIYHPLNTLVGLCKKAGIPKKYASNAYDELEALTDNKPCYMDDIYLTIAGCTADAKESGLSGVKFLDLEEQVSKILSYKWQEFDIAGVVTW